MAKNRKRNTNTGNASLPGTEVGAQSNVSPLTSQQFRDAVGKLAAKPTIKAFLAALRVAGNAVETGQLFEHVPALVSAIAPLRRNGGEDIPPMRRWNDLWHLASLFQLIEPLDESRLYRSPEQPEATSSQLNSSQSPDIE